MDLVWYARYRRGGGTDGFTDWELSAGTEDRECDAKTLAEDYSAHLVFGSVTGAVVWALVRRR